MNDRKIAEHISNYDGFCIKCGAIKNGGVEPDAVNYRCEECGERSVVGFELAVMYEILVPDDSKTPILDEYRRDK